MSSSLLIASKFITKMSTSLLAGGSTYCTLVEHPARMDCETRIASAIFPVSSGKSTALHLTLSTIAALGAFFNYSEEPNNKWLALGLLNLSILPFSYVAIGPLTRKLTDPNIDRDSDSVTGLLNIWGSLQMVRTLIALISLVIINTE